MDLLQNGDLLLFEPYLGVEIKDLFSSYINGSKYGHCGFVIKQNGIYYCVSSLSKNEKNAFCITIEKLSKVFKSYQGQIWFRRLNYFDSFVSKFEDVVKTLKYKNISDVSEYSSSFVSYIYSNIGILNCQHNWKKCLTKDLSSEGKSLVLWFYNVKKEEKLHDDFFV